MPGLAWPVTNTTPCACSRCVSGTPSEVRPARPDCDAVDHLNLDTGFAQVLHLFATAPEDERVATLEPHHDLAFASGHHHQLFNEGLRRALAAASLAHVHDACARGGHAPARSSLTRSSTSSTVARGNRLDGLDA